jgi:hypothetical protein
MAALLVFSLSACSTSPSTTTPLTPTSPTSPTTPEAVTETFTGSLASQGTTYYLFTAKAAGVVTATLTGITPDSAVIIGLAVGTFDGFTCTPVVVSETAQVGSVLIGTATAPVNLCIKVYDVGNVVDPESFTVTVVHN